MGNNNEESKKVLKQAGLVFSTAVIVAAGCLVKFYGTEASNRRKQINNIVRYVDSSIIGEQANIVQHRSAAAYDSLMSQSSGMQEEADARAQQAAIDNEREKELKSEYFIFGTTNGKKCEIDPCLLYKDGESMILTKKTSKPYNWAVFVKDCKAAEIWYSSETLTEDILVPRTDEDNYTSFGSVRADSSGHKIKYHHMDTEKS